MHKIALVYTTVANIESAKKLAREVVESKLAVCVNIFAKATSIYMWEEQVIEEDEYYLLFKTSIAKAEDLERYVKLYHPYEVPVIIKIYGDSASEYYNYMSDILN